MAAGTRPAGPGDAILGVAPRVVHTPDSVEECAAVLAAGARTGERIVFVGGGTALGLGNPPAALDAVLRTERLARVVEYQPADLVLVAQGGTPLAVVQETARAHRQRLALDPPFPGRATIGGLVATAAYGPLRARFGALRDLLIGVTLVRADGELAHGGGKVVKNVAGFDLPKVICGSLGTLGLIAEATFRLHPLPEATATVLVPALAPAGVVELILALRAAQLEPTGVVALREASGAYRVGVRFEGFAKGVRQQVARACHLATGAGGEEATDETFWARHDALRVAGPLRARVATLPSRLPAVEALLAPVLAALTGGGFAWYATLGLGFVSGELADPAVAALALGAARAALVAGGGSLVLEEAPTEVRAALDAWGPAAGGADLMAALKQRFDPDRRLAPGRFVGGL